MTNEQHERRRSRAFGLTRARAAVCAWLFAVACASLVPRQGWNPDHGPVVRHDSFPADCSLCHVGGDWHTLRADFTFDHAAETGVPLEGAHQQASCLLCHNDRGPVASYSRRGCGGCHADPHLQRLGSNCQDCHDQRTWLPREAIAMHDRTRFPLVGAHAAAACFACHPGAQVGNFAGAPAECRECHQREYLATTSPNHGAVGFEQSCERCHLPTAWQPARFDHPASFPLTAGHAGRLCVECHLTTNDFTGLSTDCSSCHTDDHTQVADPSHAAAGFGLDCESCHDTRTWSRSSWPHPPGFPLTFAHAGRGCGECHTGQVYSGTSGDCSSCHLDDYQATSNPNHVTGGFPTDCESCHNTAMWQGATFAHPETFPLEHSHQQTCSACHTTPGIYVGLDPACASCHLVDYQAAADPPHVAFGISQQCEQCHGTVAWGTGNWQHDFPINSGEHSGLACFDCHNNAADRTQFSCIDCHEHNQSDMADKHSDEDGYTWTSMACYGCHPNGEH